MSCGELSDDELAQWWKWRLRRQFSGPGEVVEAFKVSPRTAEYWWAGERAPSGWKLARYLVRHPEALDDLAPRRRA